MALGQVKRGAFDAFTNAILAAIRQGHLLELANREARDSSRANRVEAYKQELHSLLTRVCNDRDKLPE